MSYGIRKFWCWTFTQHTSFYLTSYVTDINYITHRRFSYTFINRSIDIFLEFWRFCQSSEHRFPPCLHAELPTTCYNHSIVTYKFQYSASYIGQQPQGWSLQVLADPTCKNKCNHDFLTLCRIFCMFSHPQ